MRLGAAMPMRWALGMVMGMAAAPAAAQQTVREPQAFMEGRVGEGLVSLYTFQQNDCLSGGIPPEVNQNTLSSLALSSGDMCPEVVFNDAVVPVAHNGLRFDGERGVANLQVAESAPGYTGQLLLDEELTVELWFEPAFSSELSEEKEYVLFELGSSFPEDTTGTWACGTNYDLRISYNHSGEKLRAEANTGQGCVSLEFEYPLVAKQVNQIMLKAFVLEDSETLAGEGKETVLRFLVNGADSSSEAVLPGAAFTSWSPEGILRLGSSPSAVSSHVDESNMYAWRGDILMLSMYSRNLLLSDAASNYNAWLPNSFPIVTDRSTILSGAREDGTAKLDLSQLKVYDYDVEANFASFTPSRLNRAAATTYRLIEGTKFIVGIFTGSKRGEMLLFGDNFSELYFTPTRTNTYGADNIKFEILDQNGASAGIHEFNVYIEPSNDAPECHSLTLDGDQSVAQREAAIIELSASDVDCETEADSRPGPDTLSSCEQFGVDYFTVDQPSYGAFYKDAECTDVIAVNEYPFQFQASKPKLPGGDYTAAVCWKSCSVTDDADTVLCPSGLTPDGESEVAIEQVRVTAVSGELSSSALLTIFVSPEEAALSSAAIVIPVFGGCVLAAGAVRHVMTRRAAQHVALKTAALEDF